MFLCGHNAARSQMAEGFLRELGGERFVAESAGTVASELHPLAVRVMREVGIDISAQRSKTIDELAGPFDVCVTVCDAICPIPPGALIQLRWKLPDPALARGNEGERLAAVRIVRDGIEQRVRAFVRRLESGTATAAAKRVGSGRTIEGGQAMNPQGPLPPRPGEHPPAQVEQGKQGGQSIDQPLQPRPSPQPETPKTI